jgi:hypothetical protein
LSADEREVQDDEEGGESCVPGPKSAHLDGGGGALCMVRTRSAARTRDKES